MLVCWERLQQSPGRRGRAGVHACLVSLVFFGWLQVCDVPARAEPGRVEVGVRLGPS